MNISPYDPYLYQYVPREPRHQQPQQPLYAHLKGPTLRAVKPFVKYGLQEAQHTSFKHALQEVAAITYLMGGGFDPRTAHKIVESWEVNERF